MPAKLTTTINKISSVPNPTNSVIIREFSEYMTENGSSEHHQNKNLKALIAFAHFIGPHVTFYDIQKKEQIMTFLDTKINREDNEKKWITTWNNYLTRLKLFFRWFYNMRGKDSEALAPQSDWETPTFARIKERKTKRISHTRKRSYGNVTKFYLFSNMNHINAIRQLLRFFGILTQETMKSLY